MALYYTVLASGSRGNCTWVRGGGTAIVIDCGIATRVVGRRLADIGAELGEISAVVCTHGHSDHVGGVGGLARRSGAEVYATAPTFRRIPRCPPPDRLRRLPRRGVVRIGGLAVRTIPTLHDCPGSVAIVVSDHDSSLAVVTDLGQPTAALAEALERVDGLALEFNHDVDMLRRGPYPERLKRRIRSRVGHLSNAQSARLLAAVIGPQLQHLTLLHLSEHNNTPALALAAARAVIADRRSTPVVTVAEQHAATTPVALRPNPPRQLVMPWGISPAR